MKKRILNLLSVCVAVFAAGATVANPVDEATAMRVARNHLIQQSDAQDIEIVDVTPQMPYRNIYFFKETSGRGFVLVSGDDAATPILGYSTNTTFDPSDLPDYIHLWFLQYDRQIDALIAEGVKATDDIFDEWQRLINGDPIPEERAREKSVSPLLTTTWGQGTNAGNTYNSLCPHSGSTYTYAGCTAVATAQVMKYWNHPATGRGSHSYSHQTWGTLSANFGSTNYAWTSMPNSITSSSSATQKTAVATLIYHVGVAVEMDYGTSGSGAATTNYGSISTPSAENALQSFFKYSCSTHSLSKGNFTNAEWIALLKGELDASTPRPILYSGFDASYQSGHAFVLDGYNTSSQFHINWGWSSSYDGYFTMGALNPTGSGTGGNQSNNYSYNNSAVIGIKPAASTGSSSTVSASVNNSSWGSVSGARSYTNYSDTASLLVNTNEGYRFKRWSDGSMANPRQFVVNDNMTLTAELEKISGDTLYHSNTSPFTYLGLSSGGTYYWGVKFPTTALTASRRPTNVLFYARYTGTYTLYIYNDGTTAPSGSPILSGNLSLTSTSQLGYINASIGDNTPTINASKPLWVVLKYTNSSSQTIYCIPMTNYSGNQYSKMRSTNGTSWSATNYSCSWCIQLINQYTSTQNGITEASIEDGYTITNGKGFITVNGVENETVRLIDNSGRVIATDNGNSDIKEFVAPASGVYLIQVGNKPAKKIVVKK